MDALRTCPAAAAAAAAAAACAFSTSGTSQLPRGFLPMGSDRRSTALLKMQSGSGSSMASRRQHGHAICAGTTKTRQSDLGVDIDDHHESSVAKFNRHLSEVLSDLRFYKERDKIDGYCWKIYGNFTGSILYHPGTRLSLVLFVIAGDAAKLASEVMDCAALRHGSDDEISIYTTKQTLGTYVSIIVSIVDDLSNKKVARETFLSLLSALGGIAAVSHTLLQDAMATSNYRPTIRDVERDRREYMKEMSSFKHEFSTISLDEDAYEQTVKPKLEAAMRRTKWFVRLNSLLRKKALGQVTGQHQGPR